MPRALAFDLRSMILQGCQVRSDGSLVLSALI